MSFLVKAVLGQRVVHPPATHLHLAAEEQGKDDHVSRTAACSSPAEHVNGRQSTVADALPPHARRVEDEVAARPTPARTLMLRVQTCTVVQDLRDALHELETHDDLPYIVGPSEATQLLHLLHTHAEDAGVVDAALHVLANLTDVEHYPSGTAGRDGVVTAREKRRIAHAFLQAISADLPLLLGQLQATAAASSTGRHYALQLLQRLEEYDSVTVHQVLLKERGLAVLTDTLTAPATDAVLRGDVLQLLHALTTVDTELQTLLAFDNAFDTLLQTALEPHGDPAAAALALATVQNMLRGNKATQKFFGEMNCARYVGQLLDALAQDTVKVAPGTGLTAVAIVSCLLREAAESERGAVRMSLVQAGVLRPLAAVALRGEGVDAGMAIEALRTLAVLVQGSRRAVAQLVECEVATRVTTGVVVRWGAMRGVLQCLFTSDDHTLLTAAAGLLRKVLDVEGAEPQVVDVLLRGLGPVVSESTTTRVALRELPECGQAVSYALFAPLPRASGKYYAAHLLRALLAKPFIADALLRTPWVADSGTPTVRSSGATFFTAFTTYVQHCLGGGAASQGVDSAALAGYVGACLEWFVECRAAATVWVGEKGMTGYAALLQRARREGAAHVRLWCAALAASLCLHVTPDATAAVSSGQLLEHFVHELGGPGFFDSVMFDVTASSSQYDNPVADALVAPGPAIYDNHLVELLGQVMCGLRTLYLSTPRPKSTPPPAAVVQDVSASHSANAPVAHGDVAATTTPVHELQAVIRAQADELHELRAAHARLQDEAAELRRACDAATARAVAAEATHHTDPHVVSDGEVAELRERVPLLEEALRAKEEEHEHLVRSLTMMEQQLRQVANAPRDDSETDTLRASVHALRAERDALLRLVAELIAGQPSHAAPVASMTSSAAQVQPDVVESDVAPGAAVECHSPPDLLRTQPVADKDGDVAESAAWLPQQPPLETIEQQNFNPFANEPDDEFDGGHALDLR